MTQLEEAFLGQAHLRQKYLSILGLTNPLSVVMNFPLLIIFITFKGAQVQGTPKYAATETNGILHPTHLPLGHVVIRRSRGEYPRVSVGVIQWISYTCMH